MKKFLGYGILAMILIMAFTFAGCEGPSGPQGQPGPGWVDPREPPMVPATYTVRAGSYIGPEFTLRVTVGTHEILDITHDATTVHHTTSVGVPAMPVLIERIIRHQTVAVDVVGGATITSNFVLMAVEEVLEMAGAPQRMFDPTPRSQTNVDVDVLVVGSGLAGASAAFTAKSQRPDARVILIEQQDIPGGTSRFTANVFTAPLNEADNVAWAEYLFMRSQGQANRTLLDRWASTVAGAFSHVAGKTLPGGAITSGTATQPRMRFTDIAQSGGTGIAPGRAFDRARDAGVIIWTSVQGTELLQTGGVVTGAKAVHADGLDITFSLNPGGSVILATGGFDNNSRLMFQHNRLSARDVGHGMLGCGSGIEMAMAIGADTIFKGGIIGMIARDNRPQYVDGVGIAGPFGNVPVLISQCGAVFRGSGGNDVTTFPIGVEIYTGMFSTVMEPNLNNWMPQAPLLPVTFDIDPGDYAIPHRWMLNQRWAHGRAQGIYVGGIPSYDPNFAFWVPSRPLDTAAAPTAMEVARQWVLEVPHTVDMTTTLTALAPLVNMTPAALIAAWELSGVSMEADVVVTPPGPPGPPPPPVTVENARWRLTRHVPSSMGSKGGLMIDTEARVLRNGQPIVGLYAAGDVANGQFYYLEYPGSGHGLSLALTFGYIAGRHAASRLP